MKLRNYEIDAIVNQLQDGDSIMNTDKIKISWKIMWEIDKNYTTLSALYTKYNEMRDKIGQQYMSADKVDMETYKIKDEYLAEYQTELTELANIENEIDISFIDIKEFENFVDVPKYFRQIRFMLTEVHNEE